MFIENLIQTVCDSFSWNLLQVGACGPTKSVNSSTEWPTRDAEMLNNFYDQIFYRNGSLTEKQANLALSILKRNKSLIHYMVPNVDSILDNPQWEKPFRVLSNVKKISIEAFNSSYYECLDKLSIIVEFPFNSNIVDLLRKRNQEDFLLYKGCWDPHHKKWIFPLNEKNILWLGNTLRPYDFDIDETFIKYFQEITDVCNNIDKHLPMLISNGEKYSIINAHPAIPQPNTDNLIEALFFARKYGITNWDDIIGQKIDNLKEVTKGILTSKRNEKLWFNNATININEFEDVFRYSLPILIVLPGGGELEDLKKWHQYAESLGINPLEISVMFRLPNEKADFNSYVKDNNLNNSVGENTKVVFVSTKYPKPLIKSGIKFNTVINLGYYNYLHFSMSTVIDNAPNLVYYSTKKF